MTPTNTSASHNTTQPELVHANHAVGGSPFPVYTIIIMILSGMIFRIMISLTRSKLKFQAYPFDKIMIEVERYHLKAEEDKALNNSLHLSAVKDVRVEVLENDKESVDSIKLRSQEVQKLV